MITIHGLDYFLLPSFCVFNGRERIFFFKRSVLFFFTFLFLSRNLRLNPNFFSFLNKYFCKLN